MSQSIIENYQKNYQKWMNHQGLDPNTKAELVEIGRDEEKIKECFSAPLKFGTGGLRGIMRPGINSMNIYVVKQATQAMANLINSTSKGEKCEQKKVVIAYDSRKNSELFAKEAAKTLAASGIKVYIFDDIRPTPELSFAIRHHHCTAGINITASHNPKQYNGYKAYWEDGGQLPPDHADIVEAAINKIDIFTGVSGYDSDYNEMVEQGKIQIIGKDTDRKYLENVKSQCVRPEAIGQVPDFKVVYTPLHGAGYKLVPEVLELLELKNLFTLKAQMSPDGDFPTVQKPNPEEPAALVSAIKLAEAEDCELVIATDPDCDRLGAAAKKTSGGEFGILTGNQIGALLLDYIITAKKEDNSLKPNHFAVTTIVTTELASKICEKNKVELIRVLTGFKFIAEKIKEFEGKREFLFGYEESYGYLAGTYTRDKDAVLASALTVEMAAYYSRQNMTLFEALQELYEKYGYYSEVVDNIEFAGLDGAQKMKDIMNRLRKNPPSELGGYKISKVIDYKKKAKSSGLKDDVLCFVLEKGSKVIIRPSGTEPKIKIYYLLSAACESSAALMAKKLKSAMAKFV